MTLDLNGILSAQRLALSRALSFVENNTDSDLALLDEIFPHLGKAYRIGITGPPGAGKSTLVDQLITELREDQKKVGVLSVDPTSPFTGGAILGDRVRMTRHHSDEGVFIRSMATRGSHGGLALRSQDAADILDAAGYDVIIFETVGVGQVELDIAEAADTTVVILVPESGDDIQAMKAGLMEIADIFVLNKADRQGANQLQVQLQSMLEMRPTSDNGWTPPVLKTIAPQGEGLKELSVALQGHYELLRNAEKLSAHVRQRLRLKIRSIIQHRIDSEFWTAERERTLQHALGDPELRPSAIVQLVLDAEAS